MKPAKQLAAIDPARRAGLRRFALGGWLALIGTQHARAAAPENAAGALSRLDAPNIVPISELLITSGQPSAADLAQFGPLGMAAVIYLAPESVPSAVAGEGQILARQGVSYFNIPIPFERPQAADFEAFRLAMAKFARKKIWVHCQINLRASSMVFLHRVIVSHEPAEAAYESVAKVWSPDGPWRDFIVATLRAHGQAFEPW
jgi:protein tyrosine phosphatase (PTP) superfamily phosphohydrolase (DUF442 family)